MHAVPEDIAVDARAKIMWGESPEKIQAYLMSKNVGEKDAAALMAEILAERSATIRADGLKKIWIGSAFVAAPILYYFVTHLWIGYWNLKAFAGLVVLAAIGLVKLTSGIGMVLRPSATRGSLANATEV